MDVGVLEVEENTHETNRWTVRSGPSAEGLAK